MNPRLNSFKLISLLQTYLLLFSNNYHSFTTLINQLVESNKNKKRKELQRKKRKKKKL